MSRTIALGLAGIAVSAAMLGFGFYSGKHDAVAAQVVEAPADGAVHDRAGIEGIVREYLIENPELMLEVQAALETKQQERQRVVQEGTIATDRDLIFASDRDGVTGNPAGKVTLVEFFDYNCGYCKRSFPDVEALTAENPDIRMVYKEFPILGPDSQKAHVVSMAFRALMPEKWPEFHRTLMKGARANEEVAMRVALSLGADESALRKEMQNPEIAGAFETTYELANKLSITGTPSYVVGKEVVFGALGKDVLSEKVAAARGCGAETC